MPSLHGPRSRFSCGMGEDLFTISPYNDYCSSGNIGCLVSACYINVAVKVLYRLLG
jgi:hypothetical protein